MAKDYEGDGDDHEAQALPLAKVTYRRGPRANMCTPEVTREVAELVAMGLTIPKACAALGIARHLWKSWNRLGREHEAAGFETDYTAWKDAINEAKAACEANWVAQVVAGTTEDWKAAAWLLERRFGKSWAKREVEPPKDNADEFASMSADDLRKVLVSVRQPAQLTSGSTGDAPGGVSECS